MNDQVKIPCMFIRGGTSRGPYFLKSDLPIDIDKRDKILLATMGSPDLRQIDGLGGAEPVKSKVAIIDKSSAEDLSIIATLLLTGSAPPNPSICLRSGEPIVASKILSLLSMSMGRSLFKK